MKKIANFIFLASFIFACSSSAALSQVISLPAPQTGFLSSDKPSLALIFDRKNPEVVIVLVKGYPGYHGLTEQSVSLPNQSANMLQQLTYPHKSRLRTAIVVFDSPWPLTTISARSTDDHLGRIESVIRYAKNRWKKPIWLFGHSDGSISVSQFLNKSSENRALLSGAIFSGGRNETWLKGNLSLPILVLHHEKDQCSWTTYSSAVLFFNRIKSSNGASTEMGTVRGGGPRGNDPCMDGFHMYDYAFDEANKLIEKFVFANTPKVNYVEPPEFSRGTLISLPSAPEEPLVEIAPPN